MLTIKMGGWVQCRLATDPDPYDEPRGVSGYVHAYAGEPDLDRTIRFQDPPFQRAYGPAIGVQVNAVFEDGVVLDEHPLIGAAVTLLGEPKFEGRNGVIAEDVLEPVFPFRLELRKGDVFVNRAIVPEDPDNPYRDFFAIGSVSVAEVQRESGIQSLRPIWQDRLTRLTSDLELASENDRPALEERVAYLRSNLQHSGISSPDTLRFSMRFDYELKSEIEGDQSGLWREQLLPDLEPSDLPWEIRFWFGCWDSDVQCFYFSGELSVTGADEPADLMFMDEQSRPMS